VFSNKSIEYQSILSQLSFGGGAVNDVVMHLTNPHLPFGGVGHSGIGAYHGKYSFDAFTHYKPFIKRATWNDPFVRYAPYPTSFGWLKKLLNLI